MSKREKEKERERQREEGSVFADPLSAASAPDPAAPYPVAQLRLHQQLHPPLELGWFGVERQAALGR